ncbi:Uu.00g133300.m01.CDS01 [Anthostomella pinea]|uniref:Uu.00g133300.m01.CDS01 n=1 Tax=Anthostomella pinea TaxID=933095 RepID=A0AAI8YMX9_9PEZI|nr:Uu.00g133300.m01.CDS01 [Anthostomella pinea]
MLARMSLTKLALLAMAATDVFATWQLIGYNRHGDGHKVIEEGTGEVYVMRKLEGNFKEVKFVSNEDLKVAFYETKEANPDRLVQSMKDNKKKQLPATAKWYDILENTDEFDSD